MDQNQKQLLERLSPTRILLPMLIGIGVTIYLFVSKYTWNDLSFLLRANGGWILASLVVLVIRDTGYIYRIRHLTGKDLSWNSSFYSIMLWEFASAVTPSAVGGTAVAVFILMKEGLTFGRSLAYVMLTAVLDNAFFIFASGLALVFLPTQIFPDISEFSFQIGRSFQYFFLISLSLIALYTFVMAFALFVRPRGFKWFLLRLTAWRPLRRWRQAAYIQGNEILIASKELKGKDVGYWTKAIGSTLFVWSARYLMLNCLIAAFTPVTGPEHVLIFFRQVVMWVIMLISVTPGAAGLAEIAFDAFFKQFLGNFSTAVALFWRMFTYYPYLLIGALLLPRWVRRVFFKGTKKPSSGKEG
ncbi:hypothetical protein SAMN05421823_103568 [Catalinimonas alkaloidigena]|uniref:Lysylphosphatidylglycerol synthase TM region n=1 Tax=Catalinimonas alkaloidigena TaxID=1075417 RepID=A0A1G9ESC4_9BACT|nr:lysylphosphatidylglycerol synthase transmembrane domain-containing protein [Catalinimonas alkaloidigena]SDK78895.1 hypothetical protein SAMN05421823_103568 [Catalinimonas alkaloidigena]